MTDWDAYCKTKCNDTNSYCNTNTPRVCHGCNDPCGGSQVTYYHCSNGVCQKSQPTDPQTYPNDPTCQNQCVKPPPHPPTTDWDAYCRTKCNDTNSYCSTNTPRVCHGCNDPCGGSQVTYYHCSDGVCQKSQPTDPQTYPNDPTCQNQCVKPPPHPPTTDWDAYCRTKCNDTNSYCNTNTPRVCHGCNDPCGGSQVTYYHCSNGVCQKSQPTDPQTYPNDPTCQNQCVKPPPPPPPSIDHYYCDTNNKCVISGPTDPQTYPNDPTCQNQCVKPPPPPPPSIDYYYCDTNNKCVISGPNDYKTYTSLDQCQRCCENSVDKYYHCESDKCLENTNKNQPRMWKNDPTCGSNSCANETKLCNDACPQRGGSWCKSFNPGVSYCSCKDPTKQKICLP